MERTPLQDTELHLARISGGSVEDHGGFLVVRTPPNPGYYHGNALFLAGPPAPESLETWRGRSRELLGADHTCLRWSGEAPDGTLLEAALRGGFERDDGVAMALDRVAEVATVEVQRCDDWDRIVALNRACDPTERTGPAEYRRFKERLRASWRRWIDEGHAKWWGAFDDVELVGACGLVPVGEVGRLQSVETHPDHRRRGVASGLVAAVARAALSGGCWRILLNAEPEGPAAGLYQRLGFRPIGYERTLLATPDRLQIRPEDPSDHACVRALITSAFGRAAEAELVEALRSVPGVVSLVAVHHGQLLGHVAFSPVRVESEAGDWEAVALAPVAVRRDHQRQGIGRALIEAGLAACEHDVCFVLGDPAYYGRFGFRSAPPFGLRCTWPVPDGSAPGPAWPIGDDAPLVRHVELTVPTLPEAEDLAVRGEAAAMEGSRRELHERHLRRLERRIRPPFGHPALPYASCIRDAGVSVLGDDVDERSLKGTTRIG